MTVDQILQAGRAAVAANRGLSMEEDGALSRALNDSKTSKFDLTMLVALGKELENQANARARHTMVSSLEAGYRDIAGLVKARQSRWLGLPVVARAAWRARDLRDLARLLSGPATEKELLTPPDAFEPENSRMTLLGVPEDAL